MVMTENAEIGVDDLRSRDPRGEPEVGPADHMLSTAAESSLSLDQLEDRYIEEVLRRTGGNKVQAAAILGIDRKTLYRRAERRAREAGKPPPPVS
jgi:DNA-binding NtrC family response regulator